MLSPNRCLKGERSALKFLKIELKNGMKTLELATDNCDCSITRLKNNNDYIILKFYIQQWKSQNKRQKQQAKNYQTNLFTISTDIPTKEGSTQATGDFQEISSQEPGLFILECSNNILSVDIIISGVDCTIKNTADYEKMLVFCRGWEKYFQEYVCDFSIESQNLDKSRVTYSDNILDNTSKNFFSQDSHSISISKTSRNQLLTIAENSNCPTQSYFDEDGRSISIINKFKDGNSKEERFNISVNTSSILDNHTGRDNEDNTANFFSQDCRRGSRHLLSNETMMSKAITCEYFAERHYAYDEGLDDDASNGSSDLEIKEDFVDSQISELMDGNHPLSLIAKPKISNKKAKRDKSKAHKSIVDGDKIIKNKFKKDHKKKTIGNEVNAMTGREYILTFEESEKEKSIREKRIADKQSYRY